MKLEKIETPRFNQKKWEFRNSDNYGISEMVCCHIPFLLLMLYHLDRHSKNDE